MAGPVSEPVGPLPSASSDPAFTASRSLVEGQAFGPRYRILRMLGQGGMGAVYQAWDAELGVAVALKVIRTDTAGDPQAAQDLERRLKRELLLARQITHKHVVRIHDFGDVAGVKYLTMPCIEGEDLAAVLRREGRLPAGRALALARQIVSGLEAAHEVGVVHRDLKPENVMVDPDGHAVIMDFGIARSEQGATVTQSAVVVGTLEYMAPEQAEGRPVDHRADIYAFGLILYDLLGGRWRSSRHSNAISELMARLTTPLPPVKEVAPDTPPALASIVTKCVQPNPADRYQTAADVRRDLDALDADGHPLAAAAAAPAARRWWHRTLVPAVAVAAVAVAAGSFWLARAGRRGSPPAPHAPVSVLVANFENRTGDPVFDGLIEQALGVGIEGASFVTAFPRRDALRIVSQLRAGGTLDDDTAVLVALREGITRVTGGSIAPDGSRYRLALKVVDPSANKAVLTWDTEASGKSDVLSAVGRLAAKVRSSLGDASADAARVNAQETFTAASLDAAHAYVQAQELQWAGKQEEAIAAYRRAIELDPDLGRAYAGLGAVTAALGRRQEAERWYAQAFARIDRMTDREKYRTRSGYYLITQNADRAREELEAFVKQFPSDSTALSNLAFSYALQRDFARAVEIGRQASAIYPKNVLRRNNLALYEMYAGDFQAAETDATAVLGLNDQFAKAYVALGLSQLATGRPGEAAETYRRLGGVQTGSAFSVYGLADLALYEGRIADAARVLESAIAAERPGTSATTAARMRLTLAEARLEQNRPADAIALAEQAVSGSREQAVIFLAGRVALRAGRPARAAELAAGLTQGLDREAQIYGALLEGEIALAAGRPRDALARFKDAQGKADTWLGRFDLGRAYLDAGAFTDADAELDHCFDRRGEATALFIDDIPTYRHFAPLYYYRGRAREGLQSAGASESYKAFLDIKKNGDEQGLVADARRRLGSR